MDKKVLIFSFAYYPYVGGAEVAVKEITDRLKGVRFDLITFNLGGQAKEEKIGNVNVYRVSGFTKYLYPFKSFFRSLFLARSHHYDAVWAMMANTGFNALFFKLFYPGSKFILTIQEGDPIPQIKRRIWFVYPFFILVFKIADHVTAISKYLADFAVSMGAKKAEVIPNGVDFQRFRAEVLRSEIDETSKIVLVTTGRLVKKNAVDDIVRALKFLPDNVVFKSIGSGEDEPFLRSLAKELGVTDRVEFIPYADHKTVASILSGSHIFVRPSLSEGLGNSFLEAMAIGLPIIGTNVGGIPDFLKNGETGLFCEIRDPKSIAEKVMMLVQDRDLYRRISENGRRAVLGVYDWDIIARRFGEIFADKGLS